MAKPTKAQLEKINQFAAKTLTEDDVYVFEPLMIDDQETAYHSVLHNNLLKKFVKDSRRGTPLLMNHNHNKLPVGRSFDARLINEFDDDRNVDTKSLYGTFYIDLGRNTESNMTTDDIVKGIDAGTIFDVSIGFNATEWKCSICGNDIRDFWSCPHIPGKKYAVQNEQGEDVVEKCIVIVGEDGDGELLELSLVYAGACDRATIKHNFSNESVREFDKGTKLSLVDDIKNVPLNAKIYQYYTKDGSVLFTDTDERTKGTEYLSKRSELEMALADVLKNKFGVDFETDEQLSAKLDELIAEVDTAKGELTAKTEELSAKTDELENIKTELANKIVEVESLTEQLGKKDETIADLEKANEELSAKAEVAETYRQDLINKALELGVRAQGNAFQKDLFSKFLTTLSIDDIKGVVAGFENEVKTKFAGARVSESEDRTTETRLNNEVPSKEDESEFRAFIADKAKEYAAENKVSITEATKVMYKKYSQE